MDENYQLDVYKRQALIFAYLRPEQTIRGLILEDDDDDDDLIDLKISSV